MADSGVPIQPQDSRHFFMVTQAPEDAGYYVYGTPPNGGGQYAHPAMMSMLMYIEREWAAIDSRQFGVGNISLSGGVPYAKHTTHRTGLEVDIRPLRKDGRHDPVFWYQHELYDHNATAKLIAMFHSYPGVQTILFNDTSIPFVKPFRDHDHHFHAKLLA
jgi:hypothetical protein